jgi:hypothetical protein
MAGYTNADLVKNYAFVANIDDKKFWKKYYALNELVFSKDTMDHAYRYPQYVKKVTCVNFVPEMVREFTNLTHLTLLNSSDYQKCIDDESIFYPFRKLKYLAIVGFDVTFMDLQLPRLTHLLLNDCYARVFYFHGSKNLTHLSMENCTFEEKISGMSNLKNLVFLNMYGIPMSELPSGVYALTQLQHLDIGNTRISEVKRKFCQLRNLVFLNWSFMVYEDEEEEEVIDELLFACRRNRHLPEFFTNLIADSEHAVITSKIPLEFVNVYTDSDDIVFQENSDEPVDDAEEDDDELPLNDFDTEDSDDDDDFSDDDVDSGYEDNDD